MTDQTQIDLELAMPVLDDRAPPLAPLAMPTQVLTPGHGMVRRAVAPLLVLLRLSVGRVG